MNENNSNYNSANFILITMWKESRSWHVLIKIFLQAIEVIIEKSLSKAVLKHYASVSTLEKKVPQKQKNWNIQSFHEDSIHANLKSSKHQPYISTWMDGWIRYKYMYTLLMNTNTKVLGNRAVGLQKSSECS